MKKYPAICKQINSERKGAIFKCPSMRFWHMRAFFNLFQHATYVSSQSVYQMPYLLSIPATQPLSWVKIESKVYF